MLTRSELTARLLGLPGRAAGDAGRGLVMVQIDGLSSSALEHALASGAMPVVQDLIEKSGYEVHPVYPGLPTSTPAVQAELFYGERLAVPAFAFVDRSEGRVVRMWQHGAVSEIETRLNGRRALLAGGSSYCNIYTGGADEARFCMASIGWTDPFRTRHPMALPALALLYSVDLARAATLIGREVLQASGDLVAGLASRRNAVSELKFSASRIVLNGVLRELVGLAAVMDVARGLPIVYLNLLGYDEYAHHGGPTSTLAMHALRDIDAVIGRLVGAAHRAGRRAYDVWVLSDHGQEATVPYAEAHGQTLHSAIAGVLRTHGIEIQVDIDPAGGIELQRVRAIGKRVAAFLVPTVEEPAEMWDRERAVVTAQGPIGHLYLPRPLEGNERDAIAGALVEQAEIPLVLCRDGPRAARAWTAGGAYRLPDDAGAVVGSDHPYLPHIAEDLVRLCLHPDAGDFVISGWQPGARATTFPHEHGSHGGPGPVESDAFVLLPPHVLIESPAAAPLRPSDIRRVALETLDGVLARRSKRRESPSPAGPIRLLTYNVHSCVGLDGTPSIERIVRVIARHDPHVVALQELDVVRSRTGGIDQAQAIAERLEMLLHFHPTLSVGEEQYGDAVLSRLPMRVVRAGPLPRLPRRYLEPRGAIWVEITGPLGSFQLLNTHLSLHPVERGLQVDALLGEAWLGAVEPGEAVLCGDFNALGWFPVCRRITRRLRDVQIDRPFHLRGATFPALLRLGRIDHVFVDAAIEVARVEVDDSPLARVASDHLPVVVDLQFGTNAPIAPTFGPADE